MTLDGFVEGPNRDISWHLDVWGEELEQLSIEQLNAAGGLRVRPRHLRTDGKSLAERGRRGRRFHECRAEIRLLRTVKTSDWNNTQMFSADVPGPSPG